MTRFPLLDAAEKRLRERDAFAKALATAGSPEFLREWEFRLSGEIDGCIGAMVVYASDSQPRNPCGGCGL
jgi:hypothetical protein